MGEITVSDLPNVGHEVRFDQPYHCGYCRNCSFLLFSTSRFACRPLVLRDGGLLLRLNDFIYLTNGVDQVVDIGVRIVIGRCPVYISASAADGADFLFHSFIDYLVRDHYDVSITISPLQPDSQFLAPESPLCVIRMRSGCDCVPAPYPALHPNDLDFSPISGSGSDGSDRTLYVAVSAFRYLDYSEGLITDRIYRWVYSDNPRLRILSVFSSSTGKKSTIVSGVFEFYKKLPGLMGYSKVVAFTDAPGVSALFSRFFRDPGSVPGRYRSCFLRRSFMAIHNLMPVEIRNSSLGVDFVTASYRAFLTRFRTELISQRLELIDPEDRLFSNLVSDEFPDITLKTIL